MKDLFIVNNAKTIYEAFGIDEIRAKKLNHRMELAIHHLFTPTEDGKIEWQDMDILKPFLSLAQTDAERVYCAYMAGRYVEELSNKHDDDFGIYDGKEGDNF